MPRNKVLERAKVTAPTGRNEFDLSAIRNFTALAGYLNLVYAQPVIAGTHGRLNRATFTRTADVVSPAFPKVTQHLDFFIINIKSLWSYWENFKLNINDLKSSQLVQFDSQGASPVLGVPAYVPTFDFAPKPDPAHPQTNRLDAAERIFPLPSSPTVDDLNGISMKRNNALRLFYGAGVGRTVHTGAGTLAISSNVLNLFKLAAYQKCYFEHYRNTAYESNDPYAYNLDWVTNNGLVNVGGIIDETGSAGGYTMQQLCTLRKVNYRNDYFHNIYPSLTYVSSAPTGLDISLPSNIGGLLTRSNSNNVDGSVSAIGSYRDAQGDLNGGVSLGGLTNGRSVGISVQSIRAAFALDKLLRASAYAPKHVKDQWKVQFGVDIPDDSDMVSRRLGSFQNDVIFQEVTQTSPYSGSELGDLGAKGVGQGQMNDDIEFYAQYDSIIIGVQYFMPRAIYDSFGFDIWNVSRARGDFYSRFFENLGLRPLYAGELSTIGYVRAGVLDPNTVLGFTVPNQALKIGKDLNLNEFQQEFERYVVNDNQDNVISEISTNYLRSFTMHNTATKAALDGNGNISALYFKVNPEDLDYIFKSSVVPDHRLGFFQFYGQLYVKLLISAPMGVHGQPHM